MKVLLLMAIAFLFIGCSEDTKKDAQKAEPSPVSKDVTAINKAPVAAIAKAVSEKIQKDEEVKAPTVAVTKDAKIVFQACAACHGQNAQKSALGKSKIIKGWSAMQVTDALNGYKDGSYGGAMKSVMKGQASKLSDEDIKIVSDYISKL